MSKETLGSKITKIYHYSKDAYEDTIEKSQEAMNFVNHQQWTAAEENYAARHNKPLLKYNILVNIIATIIGNEQLNRNRAKIKAGVSDKISYDMAAVLQGRWNMLNDEQNIEEKLQVAFMDGLITPMGGWVERRIEINDEGYLDFKYNVANNMRIYPDPEWRLSDTKMENCRWVLKETYEPMSYIRDKYDVSLENEKRTWWTQLSDAVKNFKDGEYTSEASYHKVNDEYQVLELEERTIEKVYVCTDGQALVNILPRDYKRYKEEYPDLRILQEREKPRIHITTVIPALKNMVIYEKDSYLTSANFSVFPVHSFRYNVQATESTSLIELLTDIQKNINKGVSQMRDYVSQNLSGAVFTSSQEAEANKLLEEKGNQPGLVVKLNNLQKNMPQRMTPQVMSPDIINETTTGLGFAERISAVNAAMQGRSERSGESGVLYDAKVERAAAVLNPYIKNLSLLRKNIVSDFVDNFSLVYSELNRIIRVKDEKGNNSAALNLEYGDEIINDVENMSLYVELDDGQDNMTAKEEKFEKTLALANILAQYDPTLIDVKTIIQNAPIPEKEQWLEYIDAVQQSQQAQQAQQGETESQFTQIEKIKGLLENREKELNIMEGEKSGKGDSGNSGQRDSGQRSPE